MVNGLRAQNPDLVITVLSGNLQSTKKTHQVESIAWEDYPGIVKAISACDLVVLGGGGLFHDYWGVDSSTLFTSGHSGFSFYTTVALLASIHKKKLMLSAVGVGPLFTDEARRLMKTIANQAEVITVRDLDSQQQLIALGIPAAKISLTTDAVFSLPTIGSSKPSELNENPVLGVSLRHWDVGVEPALWQHEVALALDQFLDTHPSGRVLFIPFQNSKDKFLDDHALAKSIQTSMSNKARTSILPRNSSIVDQLAVISRCNLILGMRLHSVILALMNQIPVVGINYDPKVKLLFQQFGLEKYLLSVSELEAEDLYGLLVETWQNNKQLSKLITKHLFQITKLSHHNFEKILQLLESDETVTPDQSDYNEILSSAVLTLSSTLDDYHKHNIALETDKLQLTQRVESLIKQNREINLQSEALQGELNRTITKSQQTYAELSLNKAALDQKMAELGQTQAELAHQLKELENIKTSKGWKLLFSLWQLRLIFVPKGSKREALFNKIFHPHPKHDRQFFSKVIRTIKRKMNPKLSWPAFAFRNFKFKRQNLWPQKFDHLTKIATPGLVSIILPVHNGERYVSTAIQSILDQTYPHFELIIVDDGSTDSTPSIVKAFAQKDGRIQVLHQSNLKLPGALNAGFSVASGEFFTWTSDDNLLMPDFLEKMLACLHRHPSWDMVYANMDLIDETGAPLKNTSWYEGYQFPHHSEHIFLPTDPSELNVIANNYIGGAFMYRRQVADLLAGYSPYQYTREDYDYWMQVNAFFTLKHTDFKEPVYKYRLHSASLTSQDADLKITEDRKYLMAYEDFRRDFNLMPLVWILDDDQFETAAVNQIKTCLKKRGQITITVSDFLRQILPIKWIPCIHLKVCSTLEEKDAFLATPQDFIYQVAVTAKVTQNFSTVNEVTLAMDQHLQVLAESTAGHEEWIKAVDIKCRTLALRQIETQTWLPQPYSHKISVVICTYNRNELLELALRAIARQTIPQPDYEVIVVDNNPDYSELIPLVEKYREWEFYRNPECLRLVQCPIRGLSYARNAGLSEAKGEWVLFLDDDALAESDLLEKYLDAINNHPDAGLIGGHILLQRPEKLEIPWLPGWERYWSHFETDLQDYKSVSNWADFPWGANWCARRQALFQIGGFRGAYGRRGKDYSGGEEIIAASLIQKLGYSVGVLPQARVIHQVDPARFTLEHLKHTIMAGQLVRYQSELDQYLPPDLSLPINPALWIKKLITRSNHKADKGDPTSHARMMETAFILSAKRQLLRKHFLSECARFKFLYPLLKKYL